MYQKSLMRTGDFLSITRENEFNLEPCDFTLSNGTKVEILDTGVIQFSPKDHTQKDIVLSSAIHGNETAPIEICDELIKKIILGQIELKQRVLFIFGNPKSINIEKRFVEENLNRLFHGEHVNGKVNPERIRAEKLEGYVKSFFNSVTGDRYRCHYDLHTAIRGSKNEKFAVYPFLHGKPWKKSQLQFLLACGVNTVLMMKSAATTFSYFSSREFNADTFTIELGQVKPFGQNDMSKFEKASTAICELISQKEVDYKNFDAKDFELFIVHRTINRTQIDFTFPFSEQAENFTGFGKGELLANDGKTAYYADVEGESIIFPNANVAIGQRALLTVIPMTIDDNFI